MRRGKSVAARSPESTLIFRGSDAGLGVPRSRTFRKRFLAVSIAGLAVLAVSLGVSFAGDSGTASLSVSGGSSNFVFPISTNAALPSSAIGALKYTTAVDTTNKKVTTAVSPSWTPVAGSAGSVTTPGDLALIDATTSSLVLNVYITNLAALQSDYSSFSLPINVYSCSSTCTTAGAWTQDSTVLASAPTYITNSAGVVTLSLPIGKYYDITMDSGGAYYCISTTASGGALSPSFYFVATAT